MGYARWHEPCILRGWRRAARPEVSLVSEEIRQRYRNEHGLIAQCCSCLRIRRPEDAERWDEVPAFVASPPDELTHGLCPACFLARYPELAARYAAWVKSRGGLQAQASGAR